MNAVRAVDVSVVVSVVVGGVVVTYVTGLPFASENRGVMHACGHDLHATVLLGALATLNRHKDLFDCTIFGLFQIFIYQFFL